MVKPLEKFDATLNSYADRYAKDNDDVIAAQCVIAAIDSWARGNALLGEMKGEWNGVASRGWQKWQLGEFAAVYFKVRDQATPEQDARIKWWMKQVANSVKSYCDSTSLEKNNHYAWCGAAIMQVGIITNDKADIEWGRKAFDNQMSQVRADGSLPKEIDRRNLALHYHHFALMPLAYMAELSKVIGEDWWENEKLQRLATFAVDSEIDHSAIEKLAGIKQTKLGPLWGWVAMLPNSDARRGKLMTTGSKGTTASVPFIGGDLVIFRNMIEQNNVFLMDVKPRSK